MGHRRLGARDPFNDVVGNLGGTASWGSGGGFMRGCSNTAVWVANSDPPASFPVTTTHLWSGDSPETCTPSDSKFTCARTFGLDEVNWVIRPSIL